MGSYISQRMAEDSRSGSDSDSDSDQGVSQNYTHILQSLINSGQVHIMSSVYVDNYYGPRLPKINARPNTTDLDSSEFSLITKQTSGVADSNKSDISKEKNITNMLLNREKGMYTNNSFSHGNKCKIFNRYLPNDVSMLDTSCTGKIFCGIFSKDGERFLTASQDRAIRVYNSGNASYKLLHSVRARDVGWSIIDTGFSPNREYFVYSTWSTSLHLVSLTGNVDHQEPLTIQRGGRRFCVFSVVFSLDGKELLSGANDGCLYIYDLQRHGRTLNIPAHEYDVNSVVFADESSQIIYSGGDDGLIKVWDRRTLDESSPTPVGMLAGHLDGITFIDSKGDGRHLISNSKDQSIKLWDVRVFSGSKAAERSLKAVHEQTWDYRWQEVPRKLYTSRTKLEGDTSIMTYRGHVVIKTLVRCRFSPLETTGQRYIYSGCGIGRVVIYDALTGKIKENIEGHVACVRDVSWHPRRNEILSASWDGMVGRWSYIDKRTLDESDEWELEKVIGYKNSAPVRRSLRLALKRRKEAT